MKFIKPENIIAQLDLKQGMQVSDFGCGSGYYTLAAAKKVGTTGRVVAVDVQDSKLVATKSITLQNNLHNIEIIRADLEKPFNSVPHGGEDLVIIASIFHEVSDHEMLIKNAYALLKTSGQVLVVDWKKEHSPFGPDMNKRMAKEDLRQLMESFGFKFVKEVSADLYHYSFVFEK